MKMSTEKKHIFDSSKITREDPQTKFILAS